jgi:hypothetical protein
MPLSKRSALAAALAAALVAAAFAVTAVLGSSHREAPLTSLDPTGDNTDVYAFTAPDAPGALTVVSNWIPFEDPAGGPTFYRFDDAARYYINVDNTGDGVADIRYLFRFRTRVRNPGSFLYAAPPVTSLSSPNLNLLQTYTVTRLRIRNGREVSSRVLARGLPVAPSNIGPKTMPDYGALAAQAVRALPGGGNVFAGQRDDPFFVDLGATFDAVTIRNGTGNAGGGKDDLAGYNVHSIVLQVPQAAVTRDRRPVAAPDAPNAVVGVWSSTDRLRVSVGRRGRARARWTQVSRLGNPLINEAVIPLGQKDRFNATRPADDARNFGRYVVRPELARLLNILYPGLNVPESNRTDIVQALLTGIPDVTQISRNPAAADTLKINMGLPPTATPSRFGVLGGDNQGFPNGRRLTDDIVDITLRVVGGFLRGNPLPLGDGVDQNDQPFLARFPYVAPPVPGPDSQPKRIEPPHAPTPAQP